MKWLWSGIFGNDLWECETTKKVGGTTGTGIDVPIRVAPPTREASRISEPKTPRIFKSKRQDRSLPKGHCFGGSRLGRDTSHTAICHYLDVPPFVSYPARGTVATATANRQVRFTGSLNYNGRDRAPDTGLDADRVRRAI